MNILLIDNHDSFTYNLIHVLRHLCQSTDTIDIIVNDKIDIDKISVYDKIIISPGAGIPSEAGNILDIIRRWGKEKSILGICLGHQAIGEAYGGTLSLLERPYHGVCTHINILEPNPLFRGLGDKIPVGRYHSWVIKNKDVPECLTVTSVDDNNEIMSISHKEYDVHGVQFHPESILTPTGTEMIKNFLLN